MRIVNNPVIEREGYKRYIRTIFDEPSLEEGLKLRRKFEFLKSVVDDGMYNGILNCGPKAFDKLEMRHDGTCWVIKLESEEFINGNLL